MHYLKWRKCIFPASYFSFMSDLGNLYCNSPTCFFLKSALDFPYYWLSSTWHANQNQSRWKLTTSPSMVFTRHSRWISERGTANWIEQLRILLQIWTPKLSTFSPEELTNLKRTMRSEVFDMKTWHSRTLNLETSNIQWHLNETSCLAVIFFFCSVSKIHVFGGKKSATPDVFDLNTKTPGPSAGSVPWWLELPIPSRSRQLPYAKGIYRGVRV